MQQPPGNVQCTQTKESTKVGSINRVLISNLECYNAASKFRSILDMDRREARKMISVDNKIL
jgi:hypothetical protein